MKKKKNIEIHQKNVNNKFYLKRKINCEQTHLFYVATIQLLLLFNPLHPVHSSHHYKNNASSSKDIHSNISASSIDMLTSSMDTSVVDFPIVSTELRTLIPRRHKSTLYAQLTQDIKADPHLTSMILFNIFQIFQINKTP